VFFRRKPAPVRAVVLDAEGFYSRQEGTAHYRIEWTAVREIVAFKRDLFAYDEICIGFRLNEPDGYFEVWESDLGYKDLVSELPRRFPGVRQDWYGDVVQPPFATNWTTIWTQPICHEQT
jgi:hypothetical protein